MKKMFTLFLSVVMMLSLSTSIFADSEQKKTYTEEELNEILTTAGVPSDLLIEMDFWDKQFIIDNSGEDLIYGGHSATNFAVNPVTNKLEEIEVSEVSPYGFIPPADFSIVATHFNVIYNGVHMEDIYAQWEWHDLGTMNKNGLGIKGDHVGIAVPTDYEIQTNRYACGYQTKDSVWGGGWSSTKSCGYSGDPQDKSSVYGAAWELPKTEIDQFDYYKGSTKLSAKKSSSAIKRATVKYSQGFENIWGNYSVSIQYGPASVNFTPTTGSNDTASDDVTWTID